MVDSARMSGNTSALRLVMLVGAPVAIALVSWISLSAMLIDMESMSRMPNISMPVTVGPAQMLALLVMWVVMMAAMMLPTALPLIINYARMRSGETLSWVYVLSLSLGYLATWSAFSLAAAAIQTALSTYSALSPVRMSLVSPPVAGALMIAAGIYQFTPLQRACLGQCRSPRGFLATRWREGQLGAFAMGWSHGLFCVGCCWALMAVLFVVGVMNALFIVLITVYVLAEKTLPFGRLTSSMAGAALIGAGLYTFTLWVMEQAAGA